MVFRNQGPQSSREIMTDFTDTAYPPTSCHCLRPLINQLQSNRIAAFSDLKTATHLFVSEICCLNEFATQASFPSRGWLQIRWGTSAQSDSVTQLTHNQGKNVASVCLLWMIHIRCITVYDWRQIPKVSSMFYPFSHTFIVQWCVQHKPCIASQKSVKELAQRHVSTWLGKRNMSNQYEHSCHLCSNEIIILRPLRWFSAVNGCF